MLLLLLGAAFCAPAFGQDAWREGVNLAGAQVEDQADARLYGRFTSGDFRLLSEGSRLWSAGARAEAEVVKKGLVLVGNFGFEMVYGNNMMGSMFTEPGYYPLDVLEFTPGPKTRQTYDIGGGLAWRNSSRWTPSATARFRGVNYAKRKDLRHTTYRQEAQLTPSILYEGDGFRLGASYLFEKTSEFVQAEQIGSATADTYYAFLDKGMRYGTYQAWNGSGVHLSEAGVDRFPVKEFSNGVALQVSVGPVYGDVSYSLTSGQAGEKGYTWFRFPGAKLEAKLLCTLKSGAGRHTLRADYRWERKQLYEAVMERETVGGVTTPHLYGENLVYQSRNFTAGPSWQFEHRRGWKLGAALSFIRSRELSTLMFPFYDLDESTLMRLNLDAEIPLGNFLLKASLSGGNLLGSHNHMVDTDDEQIGVSSTPFRLTEWWDPEQEITDAPRVEAGLNVRYTLPGKVPLYFEAGCTFLKAFEVKLLPGTYRQTTQLTVGYSF